MTPAAAVLCSTVQFEVAGPVGVSHHANRRELVFAAGPHQGGSIVLCRPSFGPAALSCYFLFLQVEWQRAAAMFADVAGVVAPPPELWNNLHQQAKHQNK
jgi:hypothetical protein